MKNNNDQAVHRHRFYSHNIDEARQTLLDVAVERLGEDPTARLAVALEFAGEAHGERTRKGTNASYVLHLIRVALSLLLEFDVTDDEILCTALLHDTLEDTQTTLQTLRDKFGDRCAELVDIVTRIKPDEERGDDADKFEGTYVQRIKTSGPVPTLLKLADKIDNTRDAAYHPDRSRKEIFITEAFTTYVRLAREIRAPYSDLAERLLVEAASASSDSNSPAALAALVDCLDYRLRSTSEKELCLNDIPFPHRAVQLYLFLNPGAKYWLESDGALVFATKLRPKQLALRMAEGLRMLLSGSELGPFLNLAGIPEEFASTAHGYLWRSADCELLDIQRLLRTATCPGWLNTLTDPDNLPLLLALIQSRTYQAISMRSPLWSESLGAILSRRISEVSQCNSASQATQGLNAALALSRYVAGVGTLMRAKTVFSSTEKTSEPQFNDEAMWAFRVGSEYLEAMFDAGAKQDGTDASSGTDLENLWNHVSKLPFEADSLPKVERELANLTGATQVQIESIETVGMKSTRAVFESVYRSDFYDEALHVLITRVKDRTRLTWLVFDAVEWEKRKRFWSRPGALRTEYLAQEDTWEQAGIRVIDTHLPDCDVVSMLPARRFALQDRLPEMSDSKLNEVERAGISATSLFDTLTRTEDGSPLWVPRVYRILDTIADLHPEAVQAISVHYDGPEQIPSLKAYLPLPGQADDLEQDPRKELVARYLVAQMYNCAIVRRVNGVTFRCSQVSGQQAAHAFTNEVLEDLINQIDTNGGYKSGFANYIEQYGYEPFQILSAAPVLDHLRFGREQIEHGVYIGIDIGAQFVKCDAFKDGVQLKPVTGESLESVLGMPTPAPDEGIKIEEFCHKILDYCSRKLNSLSIAWSEVHGLGISWPGAVRSNRFACMSRVLSKLIVNGKRLGYGDPVSLLPGLPFVNYFHNELITVAGGTLDEQFTVNIHNDGDAEALGNYALQVLDGSAKNTGRIIIKYGTSIAGGRITDEGAIVEEVAEYAKIVLDMSRLDANWPGTARYFAAAVGVRELTRKFEYGGDPLFGLRNKKNEEDKKETRIEPVEVGMLLPLFFAVDGSSEFLASLVPYDNHPPRDIAAKMVDAVDNYIQGSDGHAALASVITAYGKLDVERPKSYRECMERAIWLCTGQEHEIGALNAGELPRKFYFTEMAKTIVGTACLFSQLSLQLAHLIAQLYNVYRRGVFTEVVLSGGVLSDDTGRLVETQTKAYLAKYYDKIYGEGRPLAPEALRLARRDRVSNAATFGAAMAANRMRQVASAHALYLAAELRAKKCAVGEQLNLAELVSASSMPGADELVRVIGDGLVATSAFIWQDGATLQRIAGTQEI